MPRSLTTTLREIFAAALAAVDPVHLVESALRGQEPRGRVIVVGGGKAAAAMALGVERAWPVDRGRVVVKEGHGLPLARTEVFEGGHPLPTEAGVEGARRIARLLATCGRGDHVVACISGGGSSLLTLPPDGGPSLEELARRTDALLRAGTPIEEINAERRRWSVLADGGLARLAAPAELTGLILSDVLGDPVRDVASGPTFGASDNRIVGNLDLALEAAAAEAERLGFPVRILDRRLTGEAREVGRWIAEQPGCVLCGGETTVTVTGRGTGGRCQELALSAAIALRGRSGVAVLAAGTDGTDGPTDAAGALVDGTTADDGAEAALADNDSHSYLRCRGSLLVTGPTRTNVGDLIIRLAR